MRRSAWIAGLGAMLGLVSRSDGAEPKAPADFLSRVDHLVYATPDLKLGVDTIEKALGVRATLGGRHPGAGTRNALVALGPTTYLEIIGPDPEQPNPEQARRFGIDTLKAPRLIGWAARKANLASLVEAAAKHGVPFEPIAPGSRKRPDGVLLSWRTTGPANDIGDGLVPFFIDWGTSPHPASTAAPGAKLVSLRAEHPRPESVLTVLRQLGLDLPVTPGRLPALVASIESPKGRVELR